MQCMYFGSSAKVGIPCRFGLILNPNIYNFYIVPQYFFVIWSTVGVYVKIATIAYKQSKAIAALNQPYDTIEASMNRKTWKIVKTLGTILGMYIVCIIPTYFLMTALYIEGNLESNLSSFGWTNITALIYWTNTWVNPIIYVWRIKEFRAAFKRLFMSFWPTDGTHP